MKTLFVGPSLFGTNADLTDLDVRPPATHGDLARAVLEGAEAIGLVDGNFEAVSAIWHKEILFALNEGVTVLGAASMGALRAAECFSFGMVAVGRIAGQYLTGERDEDADVAMLHGPSELGYPPVTLPLVDVEATVGEMLNLGCIDADQAMALLVRARQTFFKKRTVHTLVAGLPDEKNLQALFEQNFVNQKRDDALELVAFLKRVRTSRKICSRFLMEQSPTWPAALARIREDMHLRC